MTKIKNKKNKDEIKNYAACAANGSKRRGFDSSQFKDFIKRRDELIDPDKINTGGFFISTVPGQKNEIWLDYIHSAFVYDPVFICKCDTERFAMFLCETLNASYSNWLNILDYIEGIEAQCAKQVDIINNLRKLTSKKR